MKKGFTLIELLVVIAIIGLLASVVLVSLNSARAKARDARRVQDITQIQRAIELYISANGHAPDLGNSSCLVDSGDMSCFAGETDSVQGRDQWDILESQLSPYLASLPRDPCGVGCLNTRVNGPHGGFFSYYYAAPAQFYADLSITEPITPQSYRIYAQNTETGISGFGFGPGSFLGGY